MSKNLTMMFEFRRSYFVAVLSLLFCWMVPLTIMAQGTGSTSGTGNNGNGNTGGNAPNNINDPWDIVKTNWVNEMPDDGTTVEQDLPGCLDLLPQEYSLFLGVSVRAASQNTAQAPPIFVEIDLYSPNGVLPDVSGKFLVGPFDDLDDGVPGPNGSTIYSQQIFIEVPFSNHCPNVQNWDMSYTARMMKYVEKQGYVAYNTIDQPSLFPYGIFQSYNDLGDDFDYSEDKQCCCWSGVKGRNASSTTESYNHDYVLSEEDIQVFPNPSHDNFTLSLDSEIDAGEIQLLSANGQILKDIRMDGKTSYNLNVSDLASGLYFCQLVTEHGVISKKIFKF